MKTHAFYIALLLIICTLGWFTFERQAEKIRYQGTTISGLISDTTEKANRLIVSKKDLAEYSKPVAEKVSKIEHKQGGRVREIQVIRYLPSSVVHDTVFIENGLCCEYQVWEFPHGCVTNVVTFDPLNNGITDSLFGEVTIDRYVIAERPRWIIVKPRMWNRKNWPTSVRVENNCGLQIKENTIFEIQ